MCGNAESRLLNPVKSCDLFKKEATNLPEEKAFEKLISLAFRTAAMIRGAAF